MEKEILALIFFASNEVSNDNERNISKIMIFVHALIKITASHSKRWRWRLFDSKSITYPSRISVGTCLLTSSQAHSVSSIWTHTWARTGKGNLYNPYEWLHKRYIKMEMFWHPKDNFLLQKPKARLLKYMVRPRKKAPFSVYFFLLFWKTIWLEVLYGKRPFSQKETLNRVPVPYSAHVCLNFCSFSQHVALFLWLDRFKVNKRVDISHGLDRILCRHHKNQLCMSIES